MPARPTPLSTGALAPAVADLNAAIATKQDVATAGTDAEIAVAKAEALAATAAVQVEVDALEAVGATDVEVAAAVASLAATVAKEAELAAEVAANSLTDRARANHTGEQSQATVTGLVAALAGRQPLDSDLTAIAALSTTAFGRSLLEKANSIEARALLGVSEGGQSPLYASGFWSTPVNGSSISAATLNRLYLIPMRVDKVRQFDCIGAYVTSAIPGAVVRFGVYEFNISTARPGALLDDLGTVETPYVTQSTITIDKTYGPGWIALAAVAQVAATNFYMCAATMGGLLPGVNCVGIDVGHYIEGVTGPLPASASGAIALNAANGIRTSLRVA